MSCMNSCIGAAWLIVLLATAGDSDSNRYGPDPKGGMACPAWFAPGRGSCMKVPMIAALMLFGMPASGSPAPQTRPRPHQKECRVGNWGYYIDQDQDCINTEAECLARHGTWGGTEMGRGRNPGCALPTKDAGKACTDPSQCEGSCLADHPPQVAGTPGQSVRCSCSATSSASKGVLVGFCAKGGIHWIHID